MRYFVLNHELEPISDPHESLVDAAEYALGAVLEGEVDQAIVGAMVSTEFREDIPLGMCLVIREGFDLDTHR